MVSLWDELVVIMDIYVKKHNENAVGDCHVNYVSFVHSSGFDLRTQIANFYFH